MTKNNPSDRMINDPKTRRILLSFTTPKTPKMIVESLGIERPKVKPFLDEKLLKSLNPKSSKGRFYLLTNKARKLLKLKQVRNIFNKDWDLIGWIISSPRQRLVILKSVDLIKRPSRKIREKSYKFNSNFAQRDVTVTLKDFTDKGLVEFEKAKNKHYYQITEKGIKVLADIKTLNY